LASHTSNYDISAFHLVSKAFRKKDNYLAMPD
jgi:hypothetical protein